MKSPKYSKSTSFVENTQSQGELESDDEVLEVALTEFSTSLDNKVAWYMD